MIRFHDYESACTSIPKWSLVVLRTVEVLRIGLVHGKEARCEVKENLWCVQGGWIRKGVGWYISKVLKTFLEKKSSHLRV